MRNRLWTLVLLAIASFGVTALPSHHVSDYYYLLAPSAFIAKACDDVKCKPSATTTTAPQALPARSWFRSLSAKKRRFCKKDVLRSKASSSKVFRRAKAAVKRYLTRRWAWPSWAHRPSFRLTGAGAKTRNKHEVPGLSATQEALLKKVMSELEEDESTTKVLSRAKACGVLVSPAQLARFFATADWKEAWSDGCTIRQAVHNTVEWREKRNLWPLVTNTRERQRLLQVLGPYGMCTADSAVAAEGVAHVTVRMADVQHVPNALLHLVPELMLLTLERAELASLQAGYDRGRVLLVIDCAGCTLGLLKKYIANASPVFAEMAAHYPDRLAGAKVINSSRTVAFVYKALVAPFLTAQTRAKIEFETSPPTTCAIANARSNAPKVIDSPEVHGESAESSSDSSERSPASSKFDPVEYLARDF